MLLWSQGARERGVKRHIQGRAEIARSTKRSKHSAAGAMQGARGGRWGEQGRGEGCEARHRHDSKQPVKDSLLRASAMSRYDGIKPSPTSFTCPSAKKHTTAQARSALRRSCPHRAVCTPSAWAARMLYRSSDGALGVVAGHSKVSKTSCCDCTARVAQVLCTSTRRASIVCVCCVILAHVCVCLAMCASNLPVRALLVRQGS